MKTLFSLVALVSLTMGQFSSPFPSVNLQASNPAVANLQDSTETPVPEPTVSAGEETSPVLTDTLPVSSAETVDTIEAPASSVTANPRQDISILTLSLNPDYITISGTATLHWEINQVISEQEISTLEFTLPDGIVPEVGKEDLFDEKTNTLTVTVFSNKGQFGITAQNIAQGAVVTAILYEGKSKIAETSLSLPLKEEFDVTSVKTVIQTGDGKVKLDIPANTFGSDTAIAIGKPTEDALPANPLSSQTFEVKAYRKQDEAAIEEFDKYITIAVDYSDLGIPEDQQENIRLAWYNETVGGWEYLNSSVDRDTKTLYAVTNHFTVFDIDVASWQASHVPNVDAFQVSGFTGAATYSLPIEVPAGPAGLQPSLVLNYNSQIVDQSTSGTQASWVGMGWSLDTGSIERYGNGTYGSSDDTFFLNVNGVSSRIVKDEYGVYHLSDENFWKITNSGGSNPGSWTVKDKHGNTYYFGGTTDSTSNMVYNLGSVQGCGDPDIRTLNYRWELKRVTTVTLTCSGMAPGITTPNSDASFSQIPLYQDSITRKLTITMPTHLITHFDMLIQMDIFQYFRYYW